MIRRASLVFLITMLVTFTGCGRDPLRGELTRLSTSGARVTLYSLDPAHDNRGQSETAPFDKFRILGQADVTDPTEAERLLKSLGESVSNRDDDALSMCFNPRHALRIEQGGRRLDLTICFECHSIRPHGLNNDREFEVTSSPEKVFIDAVRKHGLQEAPGV